MSTFRVRLRGWAHPPVLERLDADLWRTVLSFPTDGLALAYATANGFQVVR